MPIICACFTVAKLMWIPEASMSYLGFCDVNAEPLSVTMCWSAYACCVKTCMRALTADDQSSSFSGTANTQGKNTSVSVSMCLKPLELGNSPTR